MRFLHIVSTLHYGGVERLVTELALEQQRQGHQAAVYCYNHKAGDLLRRLEDAAVPVFGPAQPAAGRQRPAGLSRGAREWRPDIVHSHLNFSMLSQVLACSGSGGARPKFLATEHSAVQKPGPVMWRAWINDRLARPFIQRFTAVSRYAARRAAQLYGLPADRIAIIYNGVRPQDFQFDPLARERLRQAWQLPPDALVWGTVGRLVWLKGHDHLLREFRRARQSNARLFLILVGAGPELDRLQTLARALGIAPQVVWPGESGDVRGCLSACDYYVHASRHETLSLSILEALANGLLVIATRVGGVEEIQAHSPALELVPADQMAALGEVMAARSALAPPPRSVSRLPDAFRFETMYQSYAAQYQELAG